MSRLHDMGGRFGDGPVVPEPAEAPVFAEEWHARALAVTLAAGSLGLWTLDASRHSREWLLPADYAVFSYYEKWISALCNMLVEHDVLSRAELQSATADSKPSPLQARRLTPDKVANVLSSGGLPNARAIKSHILPLVTRCAQVPARIRRLTEVTAVCRPMQPEKKAVLCSATAPTCFRMPMRMGRAKHPSPSTVWLFGLMCFGRMLKTPAMK